MAYKFIFSPAAEQSLRKLDAVSARRLLKKLRWFEQQIDPLHFATMLTESRIGDARFRVGDYRVVVVINKAHGHLVIAAIGHRRDIYQ